MTRKGKTPALPRPAPKSSFEHNQRRGATDCAAIYGTFAGSVQALRQLDGGAGHAP